MSVEAPKKRSFLAYLPLLVFAGLVALFLVRFKAGDASTLPSALLGKPVPQVSFAPLEGLSKPGFDPAALTGEGKLTLVNVFASWCGPCRDEHPLLLAMAKDSRLRVFGINYKDRPENARRFLNDLGDPYAAVGVDPAGRNGIEWGVYGVPETFLVNARGVIVFKHVGPLTREVLNGPLREALAKAGMR